MTSNPAEYHIPIGNYTIEVPQLTEVVINEPLAPTYENSKVVDFGLYRERRFEPKISEHSEKISEINKNIIKLRERHLESNFFASSQGNIINALAKKLAKINTISRIRPLTVDDLIKRESIEIGASIFGDLKPNEHREFFMDDQGDWFFYQEISNQRGVSRSVTLHYEVLQAGILCINSESGIKGQYLEGEHLENFLTAIEAYHNLASQNIYKRNHNSGKKVA